MENTGMSASITKRVTKQLQADENYDLLVPKPKIPKNIMLEVTNACNHRCLFCVAPHQVRSNQLMDVQLASSVLRQASELGVKEMGVYSTGEPLLHKRLDEIIGVGRALNFEYIYMSTNGALANRDKMASLIEAGLNSIKFSINASTPETYKLIHQSDDFEKVRKNAIDLKNYIDQHELDVRLFSTFVKTKYNMKDAENFHEVFEGIFEDVFFYDCVSNTGYTNKISDLLTVSEKPLTGNGLPLNPEATCTSPFNRLHVTVEGYLSACCADYQNYLSVVDLNNTCLEDAWNSDLMVSLREKHLNKDLEGTLCENCWYGKGNQVSPLNPDLANIVNFEKFYDDQMDVVAPLVENSSDHG